ncbi:hypothetical protein MHBO_001353 [Bonamia ostreae]|uniref:Uncharacterized protein n=1 Tax=Bonamia ostreae TaxID=126728 RepID=A0ABV2AIN8_9EUKA
MMTQPLISNRNVNLSNAEARKDVSSFIHDRKRSSKNENFLKQFLLNFLYKKNRFTKRNFTP